MAYNTNSASERLLYSTIRIECTYKDGTIGTGTGFFFMFNYTDTSAFPAIITNKHVIEDAQTGKLVFTMADKSSNQPIDKKHLKASYKNFHESWIHHPSTDVDLCILPIRDLFPFLHKKNLSVFIQYLSMLDLPKSSEIEELRALEDILMIGYPDGIWDEINNKPILRRGVTATHAKLDYLGKKEFLIDAACYPGSSGSPVFIFYEGIIPGPKGEIFGGTKSILLGTLYAGPVQTINSIINEENENNSANLSILSQIPINLGHVIKSEKILDFENMFKSGPVWVPPFDVDLIF
jgi:V8-like Glu-specific endopeptidase